MNKIENSKNYSNQTFEDNIAKRKGLRYRENILDNMGSIIILVEILEK